MIFARFAIPVLILLFPAVAYPDPLDGKEQAIVKWVDTHVDESIRLLENLVNINSGTMNHSGVRAVGAVLRSEFDALGFTTEWIDMPPQVNRAGHLFARHAGDSGKKILLIGHLDTVFALPILAALPRGKPPQGKVATSTPVVNPWAPKDRRRPRFSPRRRSFQWGSAEGPADLANFLDGCRPQPYNPGGVLGLSFF